MKDEMGKDSKGSGCEQLISYRDNVLHDQGEDQLDRSCEKRRSVI
jgi:hypothetical protein